MNSGYSQYKGPKGLLRWALWKLPRRKARLGRVMIGKIEGWKFWVMDGPNRACWLEKHTELHDHKRTIKKSSATTSYVTQHDNTTCLPIHLI